MKRSNTGDCKSSGSAFGGSNPSPCTTFPYVNSRKTLALDMQPYSGNDIYCDLIIPQKLEVNIVAETDKILAFYHTKPHWEVHIVVTPKEHIASLLELTATSASELLDVVKEVSKRIKEEHGACRVLTNLGSYQDSKHLHIHISYGNVIGSIATS